VRFLVLLSALGCQIWERKGDLVGALGVLESGAARIVNTLDATVRKGHLLCLLGRFDEAVTQWSDLLRVRSAGGPLSPHTVHAM
jgi:hypothetical protein